MITEILSSNQLDLYFSSKPEESLLSFIDLYYEDNVAMKKKEITKYERLLPHICFSLIFNFDSNYKLANKSAIYSFSEPILLPRNLTWIDNSSHCFGIRFKFGFLYYTLGKPQSQFQSYPSLLKSLIDSPFIESILKTGSFEERVLLSNNYFSRIFGKYRQEIEKSKAVLEIIAEINDEHFDFKMSSKAEQSYLSSKTLYRHFLKTIGQSPKEVYSIIRARKALDSYFNHPQSFSVSQFGYYDHSHFYKDIKKIVGMSLGDLYDEAILRIAV